MSELQALEGVLEDVGAGGLEEELGWGAGLSPVVLDLGLHLCALGSVALFLLYCSYAHGCALASAYI